METPFVLTNEQNLLVNLFITETNRESNNRYFFQEVPQFDNALKQFMQNSSCSYFYRYELLQNRGTLYFSLAYKSLTSMHIMAGPIGFRAEKQDAIIAQEPLECIQKLIFSMGVNKTKAEIKLLLQHLTIKYNHIVALQLQNILSYQTKIDIQSKQGVNGKILCTPYNNNQVPEDLQNRLSAYTKTTTNTQQATISWLKAYVHVLLELVHTSYIQQNNIHDYSMQAINITYSDGKLPSRSLLKKGQIALPTKHLNPSLNKSKLEQFIQCQLLTHHLFPLIRALALHSSFTEVELLATVTQSIEAFEQLNQVTLDFIKNKKIQVSTFLPQLLNPRKAPHKKRIHLHNPLIDQQHCAYNLIFPEQGTTVHKRYFNNGTLEIGLRAFNPATDIQLLHPWVNQPYAKKYWEMDGPIAQLEEAYIKHLGVDYSHPYIGTLNGEPMFTIELYWAIKDEVGKYHPFQPGDYGFHMLIAPAKEKIPHFSTYALTMCMEYFFSFPQVNRMIGEAAASHQGTHNLITKVGCTFHSALKLPYKTSNLTFLERKKYYQTAAPVLEQSCRTIAI